MVSSLRPVIVCVLVVFFLSTSNGWCNPFGKNGIFTKLIESLPGGGFLTAPVHAAAGNAAHALQAAIAGFGTLTALVVGGPPGALAAGLGIAITSLSSLIAGLEEAHHIRRRRSVFKNHNGPWSPEEAAGLVVEFVHDLDGLPQLFDQLHLNSNMKWKAQEAIKTNNFVGAGRALLEAVQEKVKEITKELVGHRSKRDALSAESGGRKSLKSYHGWYLRAIGKEWKMDLAWGQPGQSENWYIEDLGGKVALKGRRGEGKDHRGQFLQANPDGSVNISRENPNNNFPNLIWKPFKNDNDTWSFLSVHGSWLSARDDRSLSTVTIRDTWETFELEWW